MLKNIFHLFITIISLFISVSGYAASLVETWKLTSFEIINPSAKIPQCYSPTGLLTYTASGYVAVGFNCMQSSNSKEPSFKLDDITFYVGKYQLDGDNVIHMTENGSSAVYYKKKLVRHIDLLTDRELILSLNQKGARVIIKWKRIG